MKLADIRDSVVNKLANKYSNINIYDEKQKQGIIQPCFFVQLLPITSTRSSFTYNNNVAMINIQYLNDSTDTLECLNKKDELEELFIDYLEVAGEKISILESESNIAFDSLGSILTYSITLDYYKKIKDYEERKTIKEVNFE
ncbi:phage tail terminator family protein [Gottschalkia purinilytica]|uniref:phage tail terminator family protein n=1 Tax=Gottschalkia purinilytica TaxID=1503 RepID=UPI00067D9F4B|nr:hypothetical protein [Gottschalkia purinilytica]